MGFFKTPKVPPVDTSGLDAQKRADAEAKAGARREAERRARGRSATSLGGSSSPQNLTIRSLLGGGS